MPMKFGYFAHGRQKTRRLVPIAAIMAKYGFGTLTSRLGRRIRPESPTENSAVRVRKMLEELGPTFVKLGQMLSTRNDLLPEQYIEEFRKLTENVPPFDSAEAKKIVEKELKRPLTDIFSEFSDDPVASGSIGQVHHARLKNGDPVVVKVKRPNIEHIILADVDLLRIIAPLMDRFEELKPLRLPMIVEEFDKSVQREMDFISEAAFTTRAAEDLAELTTLHVPKVYWDCTTAKVLVLERLSGITLNRRDEIAAKNIDRKQLARDLMEIFLHQYFRSGLFHADPHSGNIMLLDDGRIGLVDFGLAAHISRELKNHLGTSFIALARHDMELITEVYVELGVVSGDTDVAQLKDDLTELIDKYYGIPMRALDPRRCFADAMRVARTHKVMLPREFVLLAKSFVTVAMMARNLDPDFDLAEVTRPYANKIVADKFSPLKNAETLLHDGWYLAQTVRKVPRDIRTILRKLIDGSLRVSMDLSDSDVFVRELDRATNRIAFSLIVSAIVIGSSVLLHAHVPPHMDKLPGAIGRFFAAYMPATSMLGLGGYLFAGILGMLLAMAIWRSNKL